MYIPVLSHHPGTAVCKSAQKQNVMCSKKIRLTAHMIKDIGTKTNRKSYTFDDVTAADLRGKSRLAFNRRAKKARIRICIQWVVLEKSNRSNHRVHGNYIALIKGDAGRNRTWWQSNIVTNETPRRYG